MQKFLDENVKNVEIGTSDIVVNTNSTNPISAVRSFLTKHMKRETSLSEVSTENKQSLSPMITATVATAVVGIILAVFATISAVFVAGTIPVLSFISGTIAGVLSGFTLLILTFAGVLKLMGYNFDKSS